MFYDDRIEERIRSNDTEISGFKGKDKKVYKLYDRNQELQTITLEYIYISFLGFHFSKFYKVSCDDIIIPTKDAKKLFELTQTTLKDRSKSELERKRKDILENL